MSVTNGSKNPALRFPRPELAIAVVAGVAMAALVVARASGADLSRGELIVIALRLAVPFLIFRYWLVGGVTVMLLDAADVIIVDLLGMGGFGGHYAELDKILDSYYYVIEIVVALRWDNAWMRWPAAALFVYRVIGAVLFELSDTRLFLFLFPNLFENWWLYCVVVMKWFPSVVPHSWKSTVIPLVLLLIPKMGQEYLLHVAEAKPWNWTKENILEPIGLRP